MKFETLCFLIAGDKICLGMKKVRWGAGHFNGFGGKIGDKEEIKNETAEEAVKREGKEEFNIEVGSINKVGELTFHFPGAEDHFVQIYTCFEWKGEPEESKEMKPEWFKFSEIPYKTMWPDDEYWVPKILKGEIIKGDFTFNSEGQISDYNLEVINKAAIERRR